MEVLSIESIQTDFDFFKEALSTVPAHEGDTFKTVKLADDDIDSEAENYDKIEEPAAKKKKNDDSQSSTVPQTEKNVSSNHGDQEEPYSKIKEKKKHKQGKKKNKQKEKDKTDRNGTGLELSSRQQELREKLRSRIEELQAKSHRLSTDEQREKKRLKRRESKLKLKIKRKAEKNNKNKTNLPNEKAAKINGQISKTPKLGKDSKTVVNKEGKLVFSKFDFSDSSKKRSSQSELTGKDYKRLLEKLEKRKQNIDKLKEKDVDLGRKEEEKQAWKTALHKAEGEKVKDDPQLLKKSMKRKEKLKHKTQKQWDARSEQVKKRIENKQEKREKNIQARKQAKKDKKIKIAKKKGRMVPGF